MASVAMAMGTAGAGEQVATVAGAKGPAGKVGRPAAMRAAVTRAVVTSRAAMVARGAGMVPGVANAAGEATGTKHAAAGARASARTIPSNIRGVSR